MADRIVIDPHLRGTVIKRAFAIESLLNLTSIIAITHPREVLSRILLHPNHINPASILFIRLIGSLFIAGCTTPLVFGLTDTKRGIEIRRPAYYALGLGEVFFIPLLLADVMKARENPKEAVLSVKAGLIAIGALLPPLLWRVYVLFVRPEMFGKYRVVDKAQ